MIFYSYFSLPEGIHGQQTVPQTPLAPLLERRPEPGYPDVTDAHTHTHMQIWGFPWMGDHQNGWFIMENPAKMDDFGGTPISRTPHIVMCITCIIRWMQEILHQLIGGLSQYYIMNHIVSIIYGVSTIQGGAGFLPPTVCIKCVKCINMYNIYILYALLYVCNVM